MQPPPPVYSIARFIFSSCVFYLTQILWLKHLQNAVYIFMWTDQTRLRDSSHRMRERRERERDLLIVTISFSFFFLSLYTSSNLTRNTCTDGQSIRWQNIFFSVLMILSLSPPLSLSVSYSPVSTINVAPINWFPFMMIVDQWNTSIVPVCVLIICQSLFALSLSHTERGRWQQMPAVALLMLNFSKDSELK